MLSGMLVGTLLGQLLGTLLIAYLIIVAPMSPNPFLLPGTSRDVLILSKVIYGLMLLGTL